MLDSFWTGVDNTNFHKHILQRGWTFKDEHNPSDAYMFALEASLFLGTTISDGMKRCVQRTYRELVKGWYRQG